MTEGPTRAAFNQGVAPTIACINKSPAYPAAEFNKLVPTLQKFVDMCFAPIWGTPCKLVATMGVPPAGAWQFLFLDDADEANALGYHDLTKDGFPITKVFVKSTQQAGEKVSVTACHELCEVLVDPAVNLWAQDAKGTMFAYEMCDAVEEITFDIDGVAMSDFVTPAYFEGFRAPGSARFDWCHKVHKPFEVLSGGYSIISKGGRIKNIFGSKEKAARFKKEDRRMHRSEYRRPLKP